MKADALRLVEPSLNYEKEFLEFAKDVEREGKAGQEKVDYALRDFAGYVRERQDWSKGRNLPADFVPSSEYWLRCGDGRIVGFSSLRHSLNEKLRGYGGHIGYYIRPTERKKGYGTAILRLMLEKAKELGLKRVLITCDDRGNPASARIIEKNGGVLQDKVQNEGQPCLIRRYWIELETVG